MTEVLDVAGQIISGGPYPTISAVCPHCGTALLVHRARDSKTFSRSRGDKEAHSKLMSSKWSSIRQIWGIAHAQGWSQSANPPGMRGHPDGEPTVARVFKSLWRRYNREQVIASLPIVPWFDFDPWIRTPPSRELMYEFFAGDAMNRVGYQLFGQDFSKGDFTWPLVKKDMTSMTPQIPSK